LPSFRGFSSHFFFSIYFGQNGTPPYRDGYLASWLADWLAGWLLFYGTLLKYASQGLKAFGVMKKRSEKKNCIQQVTTHPYIFKKWFPGAQKRGV